MEARERRATLGLLLFMATELMFFAGLLSAYWVIRAQLSTWPPAGQPRYPVGMTAINTLILLGSAAAIGHLKTRAGFSREQVLAWLGLAGAGGLLFLYIQGQEWVGLIHYGLTLKTNVYGGLFYLIVGAHAVHMLGALLVLLLVFFIIAARGVTAASHLSLKLCRLYWLFVVGLWPVIYAALYLL